MIKFFVLDVPLRRVVAVSMDPAPDSALAPSFLGRPIGQLPASHYTPSALDCQGHFIDKSPGYWRPLDCLGTSMIIGKPAPFVNTLYRRSGRDDARASSASRHVSYAARLAGGLCHGCSGDQLPLLGTL